MPAFGPSRRYIEAAAWVERVVGEARLESLHRVRGSVSEHTIGDRVLLGMSFLRHFELS